MKRILVVFFILLFISCGKQKSDLEIIESDNIKKEVIAETTPESKNEVAETKPLIKITQNDLLKIMVRSDGAPGMFLNSNQELEGFYVELEKSVMKEMNQKYELIPYNDIGILIQQIKTGEVHSALATPILPDYQSFLNISNKFEILHFVIFLPEKSEVIIPDNKEDAIKTLFGKKIGVQTRGHIYQLLRDYKDIEIIEYPTTTVAMEALNKGEVDAVPEVKRIGLHYAKLNNWDVKPVGGTILSIDIGTSFSQAIDPSVVDRYNVALQSLLDSGYVDELYNTYFGHLEQ